MFYKRIITFCFVFFLSYWAKAEEKVPMADALRAEGKIYVVVAVIVTMVLGIVGYLVFLDRKINRIENEINNSK
ncbi:MAG: CcmD family protein [Cytophagales bacterium]|nr:MAG: CcmD family protein [Cytophagales bacterium]